MLVLLPFFLFGGSAQAQVFQEVAETIGVSFDHFNGATGELYFVEMMGAGVGLVDFDGDGDLDIYFPQGNRLVIPASSDPAQQPGGSLQLTDRLYRNELQDGNGLRFTDVTSLLGASSLSYGMGVSAGDVDNDGDLDLYLSNFGANQLLRNDGSEGFHDVTANAGVDDPRWSVGASFTDFDSDGWLDLYVVNYVDFSLSRHHPCHNPLGVIDYCGPLAYRPVPDRLFRNRGDGTFEDASEISGIGHHAYPGMGVVSGDFNAVPGSFELLQLTAAGFTDTYLAAGNPECVPATGVGCTSF